MNPSWLQKEVIETIKFLVWTWLHTNDIDSPSHSTIIEDEIYAIDNINDEEKEKLINQLQLLLSTIKEFNV